MTKLKVTTCGQVLIVLGEDFPNGLGTKSNCGTLYSGPLFRLGDDCFIDKNES